MLEWLTFFRIFGLPVILWGGLVTLAMLLLTAALAVLMRQGANIPVRWHIYAGYATIALALFHGILGLLAYV